MPSCKYAVASWDDYRRVHAELPNIFTLNNLDGRTSPTYEELLERGELIETPEFARIRHNARRMECLERYRVYHAIWKRRVEIGETEMAYRIAAREVHLMMLSWEEVDRYCSGTTEYGEMQEWLNSFEPPKK